MADKQTVPVQIQGREYRVLAQADPESVRRAAQLLDETMEKVRSRSRTVDTLDVAVLAGLNIANSLVLRRGAAALPAALSGRLAALADLVEEALAEPPARSGGPS